MFRSILVLAIMLPLTWTASAQQITPEARAEIAPTGKLRVGIQYANVFIATRDSNTGEPRGVAVYLARELGRRIGVAVEFVPYANATRLANAVGAGEWDIAFLAADPGRAAEISFTPGYANIDATFLVPTASPLRNVADVDREGVRVAVAGKSANDLILSRTLKNARLVRAQGGFDGAVRAFTSDGLDALAGLRPQLVMALNSLPDSRVLDDSYAVLAQAIGVPKERTAAGRYLREFVEDAKSSGLVAKAIDRAGVRGMSVAALAPTK